MSASDRRSFSEDDLDPSETRRTNEFLNLTPYKVSRRFAMHHSDHDHFRHIASRAHTVEFQYKETRVKAAMIEQELFHLQFHQQQLTRRQAELVYMLEDMYLQEQMNSCKNDFMKVARIPDGQKTEKDKTKEKKLMRRMLRQVNERDRLLKDLDIERLREKEEDDELQAELIEKKERWFRHLKLGKHWGKVGLTKKDELNLEDRACFNCSRRDKRINKEKLKEFLPKVNMPTVGQVLDAVGVDLPSGCRIS